MAKTTSRSRKTAPKGPQIDAVFLHILTASVLGAGLSILLSVELYAPGFQIFGWLGDDAGYGAIETGYLAGVAVSLAFALSMGRLAREGVHGLLEWPVIVLLCVVFFWRMLSGGALGLADETLLAEDLAADPLVTGLPPFPFFWPGMAVLVAAVLFAHVRAVRDDTAATRVFAIAPFIAALGGVVLGLWVMAQRDFGLEDSMAMHGVRLMVLIPPIMAMMFRCRFACSRRFSMWMTGFFLFFILLAGLAAFDLGRLGVPSGYFDYGSELGPALQLLAMGQFWIAALMLLHLTHFVVQRARMERAAKAAKAARPKRAPAKRAAPAKAKTGEKSGGEGGGE